MRRRTLLTNSSGQTIETGIEALDLGLSVKWGSCNLGAEYPWDCGLFFSWGNVTGHGSDGYIFDTDNYAATPGSTLDGSIPGIATYDAARAMLGGKWRIPTTTEFVELYDKLGGVTTSYGSTYGAMFGDKLFFPVNGLLSDDCCSDVSYIENWEECYYWTSELGGYEWTKNNWLDYDDCGNIFFIDVTKLGAKLVKGDTIYFYNVDRYYGLNIRPVCDY